MLKRTNRYSKAFMPVKALNPWINVAAIVIAAIACGRTANSQDEAAVRNEVLASIAKIESYAAVVFKGRFENEFSSAESTFQVRGNEVWQEHDIVPKSEAVPQNTELQRSKCQEIMGSIGLPGISAFDGKKAYAFDRFNLILTTRPSSKARPGSGGDGCMLPQRWLVIGSDGGASLRMMVESTTNKAKLEKLADGRWRFSQTDLGSHLPPDKPVAVRDRAVIVDPTVDFLMTEYLCSGGGKGVFSGKLEWKKQDGKWFVKHAVHQNKSISTLNCEWFIDEISFDAKRCRSKFNDIEKVVPYATKIQAYDGNNKLIDERYKGGDEGEQEYKLRYQALSKYRSENR